MRGGKKFEFIQEAASKKKQDDEAGGDEALDCERKFILQRGLDFFLLQFFFIFISFFSSQSETFAKT